MEKIPMKLGARSVALLVVDMQNAFCRDEGSSASIGFDISMLQAAVEPCVRLVAAARASGVPVIFTRYVYRPDYADGGILVKYMNPALASTKALAAGSWDIEIIDALSPRDEEIVIDKNRPSAFIGTPIEHILSSLGMTQIVVCGVTTNACVESTVRDASQRDYEVFLAEDACGELERSRHEGAIAGMRFLFADIVTVDDVVSVWRNARP
jgi:ureidoacrylate peracid hydrolase